MSAVVKIDLNNLTNSCIIDLADSLGCDIKYPDSLSNKYMKDAIRVSTEDNISEEEKEKILSLFEKEQEKGVNPEHEIYQLRREIREKKREIKKLEKENPRCPKCGKRLPQELYSFSIVGDKVNCQCPTGCVITLGDKDSVERIGRFSLLEAWDCWDC